MVVYHLQKDCGKPVYKVFKYAEATNLLSHCGIYYLRKSVQGLLIDICLFWLRDFENARAG